MVRIFINDQVLSTFFSHVCILVAKVLFMEILAQCQLLKSKIVFESKKEDKNLQNQAQISEKIDRIKRAHLNDIENIPVFIAVAFAYVLTRPDINTAILLFRTFTLARIAHTFVYVIWVLPQPARAIAFISGEVVTWYMIINTIIFTFSKS